ncbi:MAG: M23 family metallopeptidase [Anaerolineales bacterium]|nr:M23 family metallopeptidase [Anaerolineales bacterium]
MLISIGNMRPTLLLLHLAIACLLLSACTPPAAMGQALAPTSAMPTSPTGTVAPALVVPPPPTPTLRPSATASAAPTPTPTLESGGLDGVIFHDYDGDGLRGEREPGIAGAWVCIYLASKDLCARSDTQGRYVLVGAPQGPQSVYARSPSDEPAQAFRYLNVFIGWREIPGYPMGNMWVDKQRLPETALQPIDEPLAVDVQAGTRLDIALMQGYLTDIFTCSDRQRVRTYQGFDLDPRQGFVRNYNETESRDTQLGDNPLKGDNHFAHDWGEVNRNVIGIPLYAPANATVIFAGDGQTWNGLCRLVNLVHPETGASSGLVHLDSVLVKDGWQVLRGQQLGTLGQSCTSWPHVHFFFRPSRNLQSGEWGGSDPYRDMANPESFSYWTVDNQPQCLER